MQLKPKKADLLRRAARLCKANKLNWRAYVHKAKEIVVFGSSTIRARNDADLDLLIVGAGKRVKTLDLDIVSKSRGALQQKKWLGSELANHVAHYGIWLKGKGEWKKDVFVGNAAIDFKRRLIRGRAAGMVLAWSNLREGYRIKHLVKLRRDIQRMQYLLRKEPVPPSPILDREWNGFARYESKKDAFMKFAIESRLLTRRQFNLVHDYWLGLK